MNQVLDETELYEIKFFALLLEQLSRLYSESNLKLKKLDFRPMSDLIKLLNPDEIVTNSFFLHESYSETLWQLRQKRNEIENKIRACKEVKKKEVLRLQRTELVAAEKEEEYRVRAELSRKLKNFLRTLRHNAYAAGQLELWLGKAVLAKRWPSCKPKLTQAYGFNDIKINNAVNPEIAEVLESRGQSFVPVSISLKKGVTILTGANMGGKTVALLTVAFNAQLCLLGFFPFAQKFVAPVLDFICFVGGDTQDHQAGLSSFGAEIIAFQRVSKLLVDKSGLVIFDEFARSTNPCEGARFVQALCEYLLDRRAYGLVSTHYDGIQVPEASYYQVSGLKNHNFCSEDEDEENSEKLLEKLCEKMDYRLLPVAGEYKVPRDALNIAGLLKIDRKFLELLKKQYD
jgi:hypothetical protein